MLLKACVNRPMRIDRTVFLGYFLPHRNRDVPRPVTVVAHATELLAHETIRAGIDHFFKLGRNRIEAVKNPLRHQPARLRRVTLKPVKFIGRAFLFRSRRIFHRIRRSMAIARTAENTAAAAFFQSFTVKPFLDSFEPDGGFMIVLH